MKYPELISALKRKEYASIYLLQGEEGYYIDEVTNYIAENVLDEGEKAFNQTIVYGKDTTIQDLISTAKRYPMMAEHQVVIVKEAQHLSRTIEQLLPYVENPLNSTMFGGAMRARTQT